MKTRKRRYRWEPPNPVTSSSLEQLSSDSPAARGNFGNINLLTPLASIVAVRRIHWDPRNRFPSSPYGLAPKWGPCCWSWGTTRGQTPSQLGPGPALGAFVLSLGHIRVLLPCFLWEYSSLYRLLSKWHGSVCADSWETSPSPTPLPHTHTGLDSHPIITRLSVTITKSEIIDFKRRNMYFGSVWRAVVHCRFLLDP